jgi:hypothetical protein
MKIVLAISGISLILIGLILVINPTLIMSADYVRLISVSTLENGGMNNIIISGISFVIIGAVLEIVAIFIDK